MKSRHFSVLFLAATLLSACATPQERAYTAQENLHNKRLSLIEEYNDCIDDAGSESTAATTCERFLKAAEALQ